MHALSAVAPADRARRARRHAGDRLGRGCGGSAVQLDQSWGPGCRLAEMMRHPRSDASRRTRWRNSSDLGLAFWAGRWDTSTWSIWAADILRNGLSAGYTTQFGATKGTRTHDRSEGKDGSHLWAGQQAFHCLGHCSETARRGSHTGHLLSERTHEAGGRGPDRRAAWRQRIPVRCFRRSARSMRCLPR